MEKKEITYEAQTIECNWANVEDMEFFGWKLWDVNDLTNKPIMYAIIITEKPL